MAADNFDAARDHAGLQAAHLMPNLNRIEAEESRGAAQVDASLQSPRVVVKVAAAQTGLVIN